MLYTIFVYLHIVGALVLFSAMGIEWLCLTNLRKSSTHESIMLWLKNAMVLRKFFTTAFFLLLISGVYMMFELWHNAGFAIIGLIGLLALAITGGAVSGKKLGEIAKSAAQDEAVMSLPELINKVHAPFFWESFIIRTFAALGIVYTMKFKTDLVDSIIAVVIGIVVGFIIAKASESPKAVKQTEV
ncbi:MAG: hypothetical protein ABI550_05580 [Ignavibacteriaceae bacterium]